MADPSKDRRIVLEMPAVHGPGTNVNSGHQVNKGGNGGKSFKDGNAGQGGPGNGNNNITYGSKKGANVPKGNASGILGPGSNLNIGLQKNQGGNGGDCVNGGNAGQGGPGNGNNNITYY